MHNLRKLVVKALCITPFFLSTLLDGSNQEFLTAVCKGNEKHAFWLINQESTVFSCVDSNGWNALHFAIKNNMQNMVNYLVKEKVFKVNQPTKDNWYPVHIAALYGHVAILKKLQQWGAFMDVGRPDEKNDIYDNAFTLAARKKHKDAMLFCMPLMPFAWTDGRLPSFPKKVCYEMREALTREILNLPVGGVIEKLVFILSRWLQKGGCATYFSKLAPSEESRISSCIVSGLSDEDLTEQKECALLILQYLKFFFYTKGRDKSFKVRSLTLSEKKLCQKLSMSPYSFETYFFNNLKKGALKKGEYAKRPFMDLKICNQ